MSCSCKFGETLRYVSPGHGGWGLVRIGALIPESYLLFVSPFACGRHGALGGVLNGIKDKASFLYIDEADIVLVRSCWASLALWLWGSACAWSWSGK